MEMKVKSERIENAQVKLNVEVGTGEINKYMEKAYQELVLKVNVPGFRKGKTPRQVLEKYLGKDALLQEAIEHLIPEAYREAIEGEKIEPIAQPNIELLQTDPVVFNAVIPLQPEIRLGEYKDIRIEYTAPRVEEKIVEASLKQLQYQHSNLIPVDRPADYDDVVIMDIEGDENGSTIPLRKDLEYELIKDYKVPLPGFVNEIVGCNKGDTKSFTLSYPEDYEHKDLAGKKYKFTIQINEIKHRELPEFDDSFAKTLGVENLELLKEQIDKDLHTRAEQQTNLEYEQKVIDKVAEISELQYPPVIVEMEIKNIINEESSRFKDGLTGLNNYLTQMQKTMDDHKKELYPIADKKVLRSLVLNKVTEIENIEVPDSEIDDEIEKIASQDKEQSENIKKLFSTPDSRYSIKQFMARRKTMEYLVKVAKGVIDNVKQEERKND